MPHVIMSFYPTFSAQGSLPKETVLYHTFPHQYFKDMVETHRLYFRKVYKWADTYEYPIRFMPEDRKDRVKNGLFGFCLTKKYDKEAMWKLYSGNDYGVCVKTTAVSICNALSGIVKSSLPTDNNAFIGNVRYVSYLEDHPERMFQEDFRFEYPDYMYPAFLKRDAFSYEEEVRLILFDTDAYFRGASDGLYKELSNLNFIHEIILSPYCSEENRLEIENFCREHGILVPISQSNFLKQIEENSVPLPTEDQLYWGLSKKSYGIISP